MSEVKYEVGKWYGWNGGECPVHLETVVDFVSTKGEGTFRCAGHLDWSRDFDNPIRAFRIVRPYVEPAKPIECWINVYPEGDQYGSHYPTQDEAARGAANGAVRQAFMREVLP
jgi:hypothetical protein